MNIEEAILILEGCLLEPILNGGHDDKNKIRAIEVQGEDTPLRVCGYGQTFEKAIISAAMQYREESIKEQAND